MDQIERIKTMEEHLNKASQAVKALSDALDLYAEAMESIETIDDYLVSDEWQQDFDDSEAGRLPKDLKCGVLSEDGIWNVVDTNRELQAQMLEIVANRFSPVYCASIVAVFVARFVKVNPGMARPALTGLIAFSFISVFIHSVTRPLS